MKVAVPGYLGLVVGAATVLSMFLLPVSVTVVLGAVSLSLVSYAEYKKVS